VSLLASIRRPLRALRLFALVPAVAALTVAAAAAPAAAAGTHTTFFPEVIRLPNGWRPEGLVIGPGVTVYVGSLADGAIWRGNLFTGQGDVFIPGTAGQATTGLEFESTRNRLWAAGAGTGTGKVYDAGTGALLQRYQFDTTGSSFVNDVVVTHDAAYFTDSNNARLFEVPFGDDGALPDPSSSAVRTIPLAGEFPTTPPSTPNANGIETTPDGQALLVVHTVTGQLFRVDPATGVATNVPLTGGSGNVVRGDGIVRRGRTLYVVQNTLNQIAVVGLDRAGTTGQIRRTLTNKNLDVPTTADLLFGIGPLYAVNARFSTPATPDTEYQIVRVGF
jgi:hypothetical protein